MGKRARGTDFDRWPLRRTGKFFTDSVGGAFEWLDYRRPSESPRHRKALTDFTSVESARYISSLMYRPSLKPLDLSTPIDPRKLEPIDNSVSTSQLKRLNDKSVSNAWTQAIDNQMSMGED